MEDGYDLRNGSILSQSYMQRVQRLSGNPNSSEEVFQISEEKIKSREKTWSWLFNKFSKIPDIGLLNILTLEPDTESTVSQASGVRLPVRKSAAQLQYWINTGNAPWRAMEQEANDTDEYVSLSESEGADSEKFQSFRATSMIVNQMMANSREQLIVTGSSASSVDTATYIRENGKSAERKEKDGPGNLDNNIVGRSVNAASPKVLSKVAEAERNSVKDVDEKGNSRSRVIAEDEIVPDKNTGDETDQVLEKRLKNCEIKDSEVTFESKESGIGSSGFENIEQVKRKAVKRRSSSSEDLVLNLSQSVAHGRRKLFTRNDALFDLLSPMVKPVRHNRSVRTSFHPAFDSPSTSKKFKAKIRPSLLTMTRRSRNYSTNKRNRNKSMLSKSRVFQNTLKSSGHDNKAADSTKTDKSPETVDAVNEKVAPQIEGTLTKILSSSSNKNNKKGNYSASKSPGDTSSSLSSKDASLIMNEDWNKTLDTPVPVVTKKNQRSPVENLKISEKKDNDNDQGSIFKPLANLSAETRESKMRSMRSVKKNLCATDWRSSGETDSPTDLFSKNDKDSFSNGSAILLPHSEKYNRNKSSKSALTDSFKDSVQFHPVVILHDFLKLKNCCGELERENNKNWINKEIRNKNSEKDKNEVKNGVNKRALSNNLKDSVPFNPGAISHDFSNVKNFHGELGRDNNKNSMDEGVRNKNLKNDKKGVDETAPKVNSHLKNGVHVKSKKVMDQNVPENKKPKLEKKLTSSKLSRRTLFTRTDFFSDDSHSSEEMILDSRVEKLDNDRDHRSTTESNYSQDLKLDANLVNGGNATITFTNTNRNRRTSLFVLSSSDEEDLFKELSNTSKSRSSRKKMGGNHREIDPSTTVAKNATLNDCGAVDSAKTLRGCYIIVTSSSEDETKTVSAKANRSDIVKKRNSRRNKRKDPGEAELTTRRSMGDERGDRSEGFEIDDEKLEKQSPGVNRVLETKRGKQSPETRRDYLAAQSRVNNETRTDRESRVERLSGNRNESEENVPGRTKYDRVLSRKINDEENSPIIRPENSITPVDRVSNSPPKLVRDISSNSRAKDVARRRYSAKDRNATLVEKSRSSLRGKTLRKIKRAVESSDSNDQPEVGRVPNFKDRTKSRSTMLDSDEEEISSPFKLVFDDESSDDDDAMNFYSENNAGDNYRAKNISRRDKSCSCGDPASPDKRGTDLKRDAISSSKRKNRDGRNNSKIVFRTKEYWESDSDN